MRTTSASRSVTPDHSRFITASRKSGQPFGSGGRSFGPCGSGPDDPTHPFHVGSAKLTPCHLLRHLGELAEDAGNRDPSSDAFIFVLEGVLVDTVPADLYSLQVAFGDFGYHVLPSYVYARTHQRIFDLVSELASLLQFGVGQVRALRKKFACTFDTSVSLVRQNTWIVDAVRDLKDQALIALVSERAPSAVRSVLTYHSMLHLFSCSAVGGSYGVPTTAMLLRNLLDRREMRGRRCTVLGPLAWSAACAQVGARFFDTGHISGAASGPLERIYKEDSRAPAEDLPTNVIATVKDVAQRAGVSTATVSRALNEPASVSEERLRSVLWAVRETGYTPNIYARNLSRQRRRAASSASLATRPGTPSEDLPAVVCRTAWADEHNVSLHD